MLEDHLENESHAGYINILVEIGICLLGLI